MRKSVSSWHSPPVRLDSSNPRYLSRCFSFHRQPPLTHLRRASSSQRGHGIPYPATRVPWGQCHESKMHIWWQMNIGGTEKYSAQEDHAATHGHDVFPVSCFSIVLRASSPHQAFLSPLFPLPSLLCLKPLFLRSFALM